MGGYPIQIIYYLLECHDLMNDISTNITNSASYIYPGDLSVIIHAVIIGSQYFFLELTNFRMNIYLYQCCHADL